MQTSKLYINGQWTDATDRAEYPVVNPATGQEVGRIQYGDSKDVDRAVAAARAAFANYSSTSREERIALLRRIIAIYSDKIELLAQTISQEMGAPISLARSQQAPAGLRHLKIALEVLENYSFKAQQGSTTIYKEAIGVCGLITPWNWPVNQISCKVGPALATGCTVVLKPSEVAPLSAVVYTDILHQAGVPAGVFNLVHGEGPKAGAALSAHPDVDMISITGSTRAGIAVAKVAADSVKRVSQELGGKSPNIILPDADFPRSVAAGVLGCYANAGQSCNSPSRMLVPAAQHDEACAIGRRVAQEIRLGATDDVDTEMGPVVSKQQFDRVQSLIQRGIDEGATLVVGGTGKPPGLELGHYVKPTVFGQVRNDMTIARTEIFGPVLSILSYEDVDEAISIANDTPYGLSASVWGSPHRALGVARQLRAGMVHINGAPLDHWAPFGGYKQSGNGRERGSMGFEEFVEIKAVMGANE